MHVHSAPAMRWRPWCKLPFSRLDSLSRSLPTHPEPAADSARLKYCLAATHRARWASRAVLRLAIVTRQNVYETFVWSRAAFLVPEYICESSESILRGPPFLYIFLGWREVGESRILCVCLSLSSFFRLFVFYSVFMVGCVCLSVTSEVAMEIRSPRERHRDTETQTESVFCERDRQTTAV